MNSITVAEAAYMAGLLDGEGSISISHQKKSGRIQKSHRLMVNISNTNTDVLRWLQVVYVGPTAGCSYIYKKTKPTMGTWGMSTKPCYQWQISGKHAERFLNLVLPYLIIKRPQADIALRFMKTFVPKRTNCIRVVSVARPGNKTILNPVVLQEREACHRLLAITNGRRGRHLV